MHVANKVALITGGLGGIGLSLANELLQHGAKGVSLIDVNLTDADVIVKELEQKYVGAKVLVIKADVSRLLELENAFKETVAVFNALDIVINVAGVINKFWESELEINYKGTYRSTTLAMTNYLPKHMSGEEGLIVNISSIAGIDPEPYFMNYSASKAAIVSLGRSCGYKYFYDKYKVKVLTICPGPTATKIIGVFDSDELDECIVDFIGNTEIIVQMPEELATCIMEVIGKFENGDVYVVEGNNYYKIGFRCRTDSKL